MKTVVFCLLTLALASAIQRFDIKDLSRPAGLSTALEQAGQNGHVEGRMHQGAFQPIQHITSQRQQG